MTQIAPVERITQNRVVKLFKEELGYEYLGNWHERNNQNIEPELLERWLRRQGHSAEQINRALHALQTTAQQPFEKLYTVNKAVYEKLRYGIEVKEEAGKAYTTVQLVDWEHPENNHFALAEEVTVPGGHHDKRPDIVLYINGLALGVLELKRSSAEVGDGIRQNITNQQERFIAPFFTTVQWVMAGNDSQGLRYGTTGTPAKYFLAWKEDSEDTGNNLLDRYLLKICNKQRFIELMRDFIVFDGGIKKVPRVHQYFGIKKAQEHVRRKEGGIIWHTQGSGKSLVMVMLARWILENNPRARVAIITDRDELDKQIERVFTDSGEQIERSRNGRQLLEQLSQPNPRLLCSLVHKFGKKDVENFNAYINDLQKNPPRTHGELFVFVDECHRTQSGRLHRAMKAILPQAVFIGFTGTPLLKKDKKTSLEVFGKYIHTYKFNEAVEDEVVLDLVYEARDIEQLIKRPEKIDQWFDAKTQGLNDYQKSVLKKKWGTMQKVLSSKSRMDMIVNDIVHDFGTRTRLQEGTGNAMLVAKDILQACKYYTLFQQTTLKGKCAIVTSYTPTHRNLVMEDVGDNSETDKAFIQHVYEELLTGYNATPEAYEEWAKDRFIKEPANLQLLIVVDKLLTGFDAPTCTYLYLDKSMKDHGLFQAICRVNRLDGPSKLFGYIVDYEDLFNKVENAIAVYTSDLDYDQFDQEDIDILLENRLDKGRQKLDDALEAVNILCEPVSPKNHLGYIRYFCGNTEKPEDLKEREIYRVNLYKGVASLLRAYAQIADDLEGAGYSFAQITHIKQQVYDYTHLRNIIKNASGEVIDLKPYEADMRYLIDHYIKAEESEKISDIDNIPLLELMDKLGIVGSIDQLPSEIKNNKELVAETIENNVRKKIIKEHLVDPAFYERMSRLLDEVIARRKQQMVEYEKYLEEIAEIARQTQSGREDHLPDSLKTPGLRALYHNLNDDEGLALQIHGAVLGVRKADFRGNQQKENEIKYAIYQLVQNEDEVERLFDIIKQQPEY